MTLHDLLTARLSVAKKFTKDFQDDVKTWVKAYKAEKPSIANDPVDITEAINERYRFMIPVIHQYHEGYMASLFDKVPELIIKSKGKYDSEKQTKITASYEYLKDKLSLEEFMLKSAWWFVLTGFVTSHSEYKSEYREVPVIDELTQEPQLDEMGDPMTRVEYIYDDPILETGNPTKEYFSPDSEYSVDGEKVPYYFKELKMSVSDVKSIYGVEVEADAEVDIEIGDKTDKAKTDTKRVTVYQYYGDICEEVKDEMVKDYEDGADYYSVFTAKKTLFVEKTNRKNCKFGRWQGIPSEFFGFGIAKLLFDVQREKSTRRGQMVRWGDVAAFAKIAVKNDGTNKVDIKALNDPRESVVLTYTTDAPQFLTPPPISDTLVQLDNLSDTTAQQVTGLMDIANASQESTTVNTATGQTIFANAAEKRVNLAKKRYMDFYKETVILLLKLCQENWNEDKLVSITDEDGNPQEISVGKNDLSDIDFDTDIDFSIDSITENKDVIRQQSISMYDKVKDDPIVDRKKVFSDMMRVGFEKSNPESYIKQSTLTPGMILSDQNGTQYTVDESGEVVPSTDIAMTAEPSSDPVSSGGNPMGGLM